MQIHAEIGSLIAAALVFAASLVSTLFYVIRAEIARSNSALVEKLDERYVQRIPKLRGVHHDR